MWEQYMNPPAPPGFNPEGTTDISFYKPADPRLMDFLHDKFKSLLHLVDDDLFHTDVSGDENEETTVVKEADPQSIPAAQPPPRTIKLKEDLLLSSINDFIAEEKNKSKIKKEKSSEARKARKHHKKQSVSRSPSPHKSRRQKTSSVRSPSPSYHSSRRSPPSPRRSTCISPSASLDRYGKPRTRYRSPDSRSCSPHRYKSHGKRSRHGSRRSRSASPRRSPSHRTSSRVLDEGRFRRDSYSRRSRSPSPRGFPTNRTSSRALDDEYPRPGTSSRRSLSPRRSPDHRPSSRALDEVFPRPGTSSRRSMSPGRSPGHRTSSKLRGEERSRRGTSSRRSHSPSPPGHRTSSSRRARSPSPTREKAKRHKSPIKLGPISFPIVDDYTKDLAVEMKKRQIWDGDIEIEELDVETEEEGEINEDDTEETLPKKKAKKKKKAAVKEVVNEEPMDLTQDEQNLVKYELGIVDKGDLKPGKSFPQEKFLTEKVKKENIKKEGLIKNEFSDQKNEIWSFYCSVCQLTLNSKATWEAHITGRKHAKVLRSQDVHEVTKGTLTVLPSTSFPPEETQRFGLPAEGKTNVLLEDEIPLLQFKMDKWNKTPLVGLEFVHEVQSICEVTYYCAMCDAPCFGSSIMPHLTGFKHQLRFLKEIDPHYYEKHKLTPKKIFEVELKNILWRHEERFGRARVKVFKEVESRAPSSQPSTSGTSRRMDKEEMIKIKTERREECDEPETADGNDYLDTTKGDFYCTLCDAHMNNINMWNAHVIGKRHLKNGKKTPGESISKLKSVPSPDTPSELEEMIDSEAKEELIVGLDCIQETQLRNGAKYTCHLCGSCCTNFDVLDHLISTKHKKRYLEQMDADGKKNDLSTIRHLDIQSDQFRASLIDEQCYMMIEKYGRGKVKVYVSKK